MDGKYIYVWRSPNAYDDNNTVRMITDILVDGVRGQKSRKRTRRGKFGGWERELVAEKFEGVLHDDKGTPRVVYVASSFFSEILYRGFGDRNSQNPIVFNKIHVRPYHEAPVITDDRTSTDIQIHEVHDANRYINKANHIHI